MDKKWKEFWITSYNASKV